MRKPLTIFLTALLLTGIAAAQDNSDTVGPGLIGPDHPLYPLENTVIDPAQQAIGLKSAAEIAQERAAEAQQASRQGNMDAANQALTQFENVRQQIADAADTEGLNKAADILEELREETPKEADQGLNTALDNVLNRTQEQVNDLRETAPQAPSNSVS